MPRRHLIPLAHPTPLPRRGPPALPFACAPSVPLPRPLGRSPGSGIFSARVLAVEDCERVVQDMGFPYIHFLHSYYYA